MDSERADGLPLDFRQLIQMLAAERQSVRKEPDHTCLPSIAMEVLVPVRPRSPVRRYRLRRRQAQQVAECWVNRCNFHIRHPPVRDQIWVRPAGNAAATVNGPRCLGRL